ncbi:MAG: NAD(P)-dependent oxidoreductase, partial [Chthonomonadales bacterium]
MTPSPSVVLAVILDEPNLDRMKTAVGDCLIEAYTADELTAAISNAEILLGGWPTESDIRSASHLNWFQAFSAGVNSYPLKTMEQMGIALTNSSGAHGPQIAENVFSMMLGFAVGIPDMIRFQDKCAWKKSVLEGRKFELYGQTILLIGLGAIGEAIATRARAFGMTVHGIRRSPTAKPEFVDEMFDQSNLH